MKEKQVSDKPDETTGDPGQTGSQPEGPIPFDLRFAYQDPDDPENVMTGEVLKAKLNRGNLADKLMSEKDKAIVAAKQAEQRAEEVAAELAMLKQQMQEQAERDKLRQNLKAMGITKPQDTEPGVSDWLTEEPDGKLTEDKALELIGTVENRIQETLPQMFEKFYQEQRQRETEYQQSREHADGFMQRANKTNLDRLRTEFSDLPDDKITELGDLANRIMVHTLGALKAAEQGDHDTAEEAWVNAATLRAQESDLRAKAMIEQAKLSADRERREAVEMLNRGGGVSGEPGAPRKPIASPKEREQRRLENLAKAREIAQKREMYKAGV